MNSQESEARSQKSEASRMAFKFWLRRISFCFLLMPLLLLSSCFLVFVSDLFASTGARFLKIDPSPRSYALGGVRSVGSIGAESMNANPAQLGFLNGKYEFFSAFLSYTQSRSSQRKRFLKDQPFSTFLRLRRS